MQQKVKALHHIKYTCTVDTIFYLGETLMGENPNNLSYEDIFHNKNKYIMTMNISNPNQ